MTFGSVFGRVLSPTFQPSSQAAAAAGVSKTNLIAWWTLDETSGTRYDSYGDNDFSDNGTVGYSTGVKGNAADFEISIDTEYLLCADNDAISFGGTDFTIAFWVYLESDTTPFQFLVSKRIIASGKHEFQIVYDKSTKTIYFSLYNGGENTLNRVGTSSTLSVETWYFVVCTFNNTSKVQNISINAGTPDTSTATGFTIANGAADLVLGRYQGSLSSDDYALDGMLDEVAIWKRVLTADEITWLYNGGAGRTYTDL